MSATQYKMLALSVLTAVAVGSVAVARPAEARDEVRLRARLSGPAMEGLTPSGHADFRVRGDRVKFSTEVEDVNLAPGTTLTVFADGASVGAITLGGPPVRGGDLNLDSRLGHIVPSVAAGDIVRVDSPNGMILSGTLQVKSSGGAEMRSTDDRGNRRGNFGDGRGGRDDSHRHGRHSRSGRR